MSSGHWRTVQGCGKPKPTTVEQVHSLCRHGHDLSLLVLGEAWDLDQRGEMATPALISTPVQGSKRTASRQMRVTMSAAGSAVAVAAA
jgi:hypothetical protein